MRKKTYLKLAEYQTEQSAKHLNEVRSIHREMRGYKHDFHHHLQTLKGYLEAGEVERALAYIEQLDHRLMNVDTLLKTGNVSLDAILSAKIAQARAEDIAVSVKANVPDTLTISDLELSILVGNLLDNAIEACRIAEGERFIRIFIAMKGTMLYFSMLNSSGAKKKKTGSLFATHKDGVHGFGLRRAEAILKEHGGWVKYNSEDGAFTSEFLVPAVPLE
ncbi:MAG: GHKL domain-containing protein [Clostridia bacterium]|nr:GHKL domain-containing protein [Clostridia bacterium]